MSLLHTLRTKPVMKRKKKARRGVEEKREKKRRGGGGGRGEKKEEENQASEIYVLFSSSHIFQEQKLYKTTEISLLRSDGGGEGSFFE